MIVVLKAVQLAVSICVVGLFLLIYPGLLVILACAVGLCYVAASIAAAFDVRAAIWVAFAFSVMAAVLTTLGVARFLANGFDFLVGHYPQQTDVYLPAYLFVAIATASSIVVLMHLMAWRWMLHGSDQGSR